MRTYAIASMESVLVNRSRQSPCAGRPVLPVSPFEALPSSRSSELKCTVSPASMARVNVPKSRPASSKARIDTAPFSSEGLTTRTNPCQPRALAAEGKNGISRGVAVPASLAAVVRSGPG